MTQTYQLLFYLRSTPPSTYTSPKYLPPSLPMSCARSHLSVKKNCISIFTGVTILVSQTVLSLLIRRVITKTSEAIPLLGTKSQTKEILSRTLLNIPCSSISLSISLSLFSLYSIIYIHEYSLTHTHTHVYTNIYCVENAPLFPHNNAV